MSTLQARVEAHIGTVTETVLLEAGLNEALENLVQALPPDKGRQYAQEKSALGSAGVSVTGRVFDIRVGDRVPKIVPYSRSKDVVAGSTTSIYGASELFPAAWTRDGKWFGYPTTEQVYVLCLEPPTVAPSDSAIASFPKGTEDLAILYSCWAILVYRLGRTLSAPNAPSPDSAAALASLLGTQAEGSIGSLTDQLDTSKWFSTLGQLVENEEDPELAQQATGRIRSFIEAAGVESQEAVGSYSAEVQAWQAEVQQAIQEAEYYRGAYNEKLNLLSMTNDGAAPDRTGS